METMLAEEAQDQDSCFSTILTSFWWALVTMTTVGYGDTYPVEWAGKCVASAAMVSGILVLALLCRGAGSRRAAHAVQGALERARLREDGDPVGRDFAARGLEHGLELLLGELVVAIALVEQQRGHGDHDLLLVAAGEFSEGRRHLNCVFTFKLKKALNHVCAGISGTCRGGGCERLTAMATDRAQ